jgi:transcriptional regulator of acetoin/glycerol metabolism
MSTPFLRDGEMPSTFPRPLASLEEVERWHIVNVLEQVKFNKALASRILGIDRATLYRKAQRHGINLRKAQGGTQPRDTLS